jgi:hypothetical protein
MQIVKQKRNYWRVEPGSTEMPYATLELTSDYDTKHKWQHGWHVRLRAFNGLVTGHGGVYPTKDAAATAAVALLTR